VFDNKVLWEIFVSKEGYQ